MSTDIIERLRTDVLWHRRRCNETIARDCEDAANELATLRSKVAALEADAAKLLDMAMMLRTCAWALRRGSSPDLGERALELLKKHDLLGSTLRRQ